MDKTRNLKVMYNYTIMDTVVDIEKICTICFDNIECNNIMLKCGHNFHSECISKLLKNTILESEESVTCPLCRQHVCRILYEPEEVPHSPSQSNIQLVNVERPTRFFVYNNLYILLFTPFVYIYMYYTFT